MTYTQNHTYLVFNFKRNSKYQELILRGRITNFCITKILLIKIT